MTRRPVLVIHGGAGKASKDEPARAEAERALETALAAGWAILNGGGAALDAVEVAVASMEASGCFNAGRGAVADRDGRVTLDAAIMDGTTRATGAVAAVEKLARAIPAARLVMDRTAHVLLVGASADAFALAGGVPAAAPGYFRAARAAEAGTVGAVALDGAGRLAAATATGGLAGKLPGRVGDSALVGAGTWADGRCAVSATGSGETFIRAAFAAQIAHGLATGGRSLVEATGTALADVVGLGGHGGCIAVDVDGNAAMPFTTEVMYRGIVIPGELPRTCIFPEEIIEK